MLVNVAKLKNDFVTIWSLDVIGHLWLIRYFGSNHIWHLWDSWFSSSSSFWASLRNYDFILKVVKWLSLAGGWLVDVWGAVHSHVKVNVCRKHHLKASWWMQCGFHMSSLHISQRFGMISPDPLVKHIANLQNISSGGFSVKRAEIQYWLSCPGNPIVGQMGCVTRWFKVSIEFAFKMQNRT